jgi:4'-phosphopantetheinyl transferase
MIHALPPVREAPAVRLWRIELSGAPSPDDLAVLDAQERDRAARFAFEPLCRRYVIAHAAVRRLLGQALGRDPASLVWEFGSQGKPSLHPNTGLWFNWSHSEDLALLAMSSEQDLGVDIEIKQPTRPLRDAAALARTVLTSSEQRWVHAAGEPELASRFLSCWTRKEACIKAIGSGLSLAPQTFDAGAGDGTAQLELAWCGRTWPLTVMPLEAGSDVVAALALHS